jgi:hypothetical protein
LLKKFEEAYGDGEHLSVRRYVAALECRAHELAARVQTGEHGQLWADLRDAWADFDAATKEIAKRQATGDSSGAAAAQAKADAARQVIGKLITAGADNEAAWQALAEWQDLAARMSAREWKRLVDLRSMMPMDRVLALARETAVVVTETLSDQSLYAAGPMAVRREIGNRMAALLERGPAKK